MFTDLEHLGSCAVTLLSTASSAVEQDTLKNIDKHLSGLCGVDGIVKEDEIWPSSNPYPAAQLVTLISNDDVLNKLTCYVFDRRYGWSEAGRDGGRRVRRMSSTGTTLEASDGQMKAVINDLLDNIIKWYSKQPLSIQLIQAFQYTLKQVSEVHVVRNRTVVHMMDWLRENKDSLQDFQYTQALQELIITALTDVWSAIRSSCAKALGPIISHFPLCNQESFFTELVKLCMCDESSWQVKEGAIMGINSILHQYSDKIESRSQTPQFCLQGQQQDLQKRVPSFLSKEIHNVVFKLLKHPQLTIREHAAKSLSTYISCSDAQEALSTLNQVIQQLLRGMEDSSTDQIQSIKLPITFLDAYAAEGLLNVSIFLVKVLPLSELLSQWPTYINSFLLYLSHPASTVRQAASLLFKYFVSKCSHCAVMASFLLQSLVQGWIPDTEILQREEKGTEQSNSSQVRPSVMNGKGGFLLDAWESREGRLLAYELILKFLIKNHWLYTFGPASSSHLSQRNTQEQDSDDEENNITEENSIPYQRIHSISGTEESHGQKDLHESNSEQSLSHCQSGMYESNSEQSLSVQFKSEGGLKVTGYDRNVSEISGNKPPNQFNTTFSVLSQLQHLDSSLNKNISPNNKHINQHNNNVHRISESLAKMIDLEDNWMKNIQLSPLKSILKKILLQTLECLSDSQWELRRMTQQVLPCLAEVIRWYDITILEDIWREYLSTRPSLLSYAAVVLLRESILHCIRLRPLLERPPPTWQNEEFCKEIIQHIVTSVTQQIPKCLPSLDQLVQRSRYDRLSVTATTTIILAHAHFIIPNSQRVSQIATVLSYWKLLFGFTHPNTRITKELLLQGTDIRLFSSPFEGYLSCCLVKPENKLQCAKQVEKLFVSESHRDLRNFLQRLPVESVCSLLPIITHYTALFFEDSHVCKHMTECLYSIGLRVVDHISQGGEDKQMCLKCLHLTLKELASIITMRSIEVHLVQKVLNTYLVLCKPINPVKYLKSILVAICSRISEGIYFSVEHSPRPDDDLSLLSNDIPVSSSSDSLSDLDVEDSVIIGSPGHFPECLTLNLSNNSLPSGHLSSLSQGSDRICAKSPASDKDSESSDWDSWDDEDDEGHSALTEAFGEFLKKLQKVCNAGSYGIYEAEIKKLETRERSLIREILD